MTNEVYGVVYTESVAIPGDERSRTHPGHGYPEHTKSYKVFEEFKDKDALIAWIKREEAKSYGKRNYKAYECRPLSVTTSVEVKLD